MLSKRITTLRRPYRYGELVEKLPLDVLLPAAAGRRIDERRLLERLRASLSYSALEKIGLLASLARMSQAQIDNVMKLLDFEAERFFVISLFDPETVRDHEIAAARDWQIVLKILGSEEVRS